MPGSAKRFIDLLESQELLSDEVVSELRRQVAESKTRLTPELLAKLLVDNGHLTKFQATKLMSQVGQPKSDVSSSRSPEDEELSLADSPHDSSSKEIAEPVAEVFLDEEDDTSEVVDDDDIIQADTAEVVEVEAVEDQDADQVEVVDVVEEDDQVEVVEAVADPTIAGPPPRPRTAVKKPNSPAKYPSNPWDSFRILGVGIILALVLVAGFFLVNYFFSASAEERIELADTAYEQRSYEDAAALYQSFSESFPSHSKASYAKVRHALAMLRKDAEGAPNPAYGLETALEVLPRITDESALSELQSDLAGILVGLAEKFNQRADSRSDNEERRALMEDMGRLMELINNPQYVGPNQRNQQAPSLVRIAEDRQRILREINRNDELRKALEDIDTLLANEETLGAYAVRRELINRYPLLESNDSLRTRVDRATEIQRGLVKSSPLSFARTDSASEAEADRSFVLADRSGESAPQLSGYTLFTRAKGSVYGIDGESGEILWHKYVGRRFDAEPLRLGDGSSPDALISQPEKGTLMRVTAESGEPKWLASSDTAMLTPVLEEEELFVATYEGDIACLDSVSGQTKWIKRLPQPIEVAPGVAYGKPHIYLPAEHSNLYVLDRRSGECAEVHYSGHRAGSISVPPILLLGQLFVFENINHQSARIRILSTSDEGLELTTAQNSIPVDGNIVVSPQVDGRRMIIQSDLGQVLVLDVEPTADSQKVTTIASVPKNLYTPQISWAVAESNKIWVGDTRFTRFDLIVSKGQLNRAWIRNDGDTFVGRPQKFGDVIVHTRVQRGNRGVRVAAVDAGDGQPLWQTDLAVPISLLHRQTDGKFDAVNSDAAYYTLHGESIRIDADANPGQGKSASRFTNPVPLSDTQVVMFNQSRPNQMAVYTAQERRALRILSANFGSAAPTTLPTPAGERFAVGLDNGQFVLVDPGNGSIASSPYQPPIEAGQRVTWNRAVYQSDDKTLVVASDLQKLVRLSAGEALRPLNEVDLESPLIGPLAQLGSRIFAVESTAGRDSLMLFDATELSVVEKQALDGRLIAGPHAVGELCVLQTDLAILAFDGDGQLRWSLDDFPESELATPPLLDGDRLLLASRSGEIWNVEADSGEVVGSLDIGQPISSNVLIDPQGFLVGTTEGSILAVPLPENDSKEE